MPSQLALKEVSQELRAYLWAIIYASMKKAVYRSGGMYSHAEFLDPWSSTLRTKHIFRDHRMVDDFDPDPDAHFADIRAIIETSNYVKLFDFLQWLLSLRPPPIASRDIANALIKARAAYRLLDDGRTIVPITSKEEAIALNKALADLSSTEFEGAQSHMREAARLLNDGSPADSIRESIHSVESVARAIGGTDKLSGALQALRAQGSLHPALEKAFGSLYGYTCEEKGIRHALIDAGAAAVDETDAIFMIGACASFVSYMISKRRIGAASPQ